MHALGENDARTEDVIGEYCAERPADMAVNSA